MNSDLRGRLSILTRVIAAYSDDLTTGPRTPAEQSVASVLDALHTAILLQQTADLARLVKPWLDARLVGAVVAMPLDDQAREDAISSPGDNL